MPEVVVLGSLNMDLVVQTARHPRPGETVAGANFVTVPGGKGANQAAAAARLGASVAMVGRVGADAFGQEIIANLADQGVQTDAIMVDEAQASGIAMIVVDQAGENTIVLAPGANGAMSPADLERARALLAQAQYLVLQFEIPLHVVRQAIALANELGVSVVLNPAPAYRVAADFLAGVDILVVNETEAELLSGQAVNEPAEAALAAQALQALGPRVVIITLGAQGALLRYDEQEQHIAARQVKVVDTTAAGDTFVGGLVVARLQAMPWPKAVRYAVCAGTLATLRLGAQTSIPTATEVQTLFERDELPLR